MPASPLAALQDHVTELQLPTASVAAEIPAEMSVSLFLEKGEGLLIGDVAIVPTCILKAQFLVYMPCASVRGCHVQNQEWEAKLVEVVWHEHS
jgi:hypothetical protein